MERPVKRVTLIVLDSVGCGETPDAKAYGDLGSDTLGNLSRKVGGLALPELERLGLGNTTTIMGVRPMKAAGASGRMAEASNGKDTTTGHWELAGLRVTDPFTTYTNGFPPEILDPFRARTGRGVLGNKAASGTTILDELGAEHVKTGDLIVYTSGDSVFQIAAHEDVVPVAELHRICRIAREILDPFRVGRVIARPFVGDGPGHWKRTYNRKDFAMLPPTATVLDAVRAAELPVVGIGKISDIYCGQGITRDVHSEGNADGLVKMLEVLGDTPEGLIFNNLVDFDMLYGHRRDPAGYAACLAEFDAFVPRIEAALGEGDLVLVTADHGNDPTYRGTDHTREHVPLLAFGPACKPGVDLGTRRTFADVGATIAEALGVAAPPEGTSLLRELVA